MSIYTIEEQLALTADVARHYQAEAKRLKRVAEVLQDALWKAHHTLSEAPDYDARQNALHAMKQAADSAAIDPA